MSDRGFPLVSEVLGRVLSESEEAGLAEYLEALYSANVTTNLTRVPREEAEARHLADSALVVEFVDEGARVLDVGTGPGLPAWVLALLRPDCRVVGMDSAGKMVRFLESRGLANLEARQQRAEEEVEREGFDFVTGRAVAPFGIQAELCAPWVRVGGLFVPFRTPSEEAEIVGTNVGVLGIRLRSLERRWVGDAERLFPVYEKVRATPGEYPRSWARIRGRPLSG